MLIALADVYCGVGSAWCAVGVAEAADVTNRCRKGWKLAGSG